MKKICGARENERADVPRTFNDFHLPAEWYTNLMRELRAVLDVPLTARQPVRTLRNSIIHPWEVRSCRVRVIAADEKDETAPQIASHVAFLEVEAAHANRIGASEFGYHVNTAIRSNGEIDVRRVR